jgi:hypothetical protein
MNIKDKILKECENDNIVVAGIEGLQVMPLKEFIKQPVDGMLYDLNRGETVVLTFIDDPKWVNDFAVCRTIRALKARIEELELPCDQPEEITDQEIEKEFPIKSETVALTNAYIQTNINCRIGAKFVREWYRNKLK